MSEPVGAEEVFDVGYINEDMEHVLIGVRNPTLCNRVPKPDIIQIALTIENAIILRAKLNAFLAAHGIRAN